MEPYRIVLTGGPCAGKTTALSRLESHLAKFGYRVYRVPEMATLIFNGGVDKEDLGDSFYRFGFQDQMMKMQINLEKCFSHLARDIGKPSVIVCDRGLMDCKAFMDESLWSQVLDENGWTEVGLRDKHYDAVIHLETAAIGAEEFYTLENNSARTETAEEASLIDNKLKSVWTGHPHLRVIDNSTNFEKKIDRVISSICDVVGIPQPFEIERKFLVKNVSRLPDYFTKVHIIQDYYEKDGKEFRIRSRGQDQNYVYTKTEKSFVSKGVRIEKESKISPRKIHNIVNGAKHIGRVEKERTLFLYNGQYFQLDEFKKPDSLVLLELELHSMDDPFEIPPFIEVEKEVTGEDSYSNRNLSLGNYGQRKP